jgi:hypothetical protein
MCKVTLIMTKNNQLPLLPYFSLNVHEYVPGAV